MTQKSPNFENTKTHKKFKILSKRITLERKISRTKNTTTKESKQKFQKPKISTKNFKNQKF